ncbi:TM0106 family RecB-like putative nuclease [Cellulomonas sp.]|uniref:TM0106 family RecB-like putative nuclease n=1 Tax=Cellulomonas sp. TaxID=40001 RepID=UPI001AFE6418|nr:TM0106 family RecB-like putative nuclease [Cellulomonas sp.]MBO9553610.1 TM0106 family RecB-like putative nuclease [Cellulomonas sp.]
MLLLDDGALVLSPSDLSHAATCELAVVRSLDGRLGWGPPVVPAADAMLERVAALGTEHERTILRSYLDRFGPWDEATGRGVVTLRRARADRESLTATHERTMAVLAAGADVVYQAGFFDGRFTGYADFLVRTDDGRYEVHDTKLARTVKVTALLQLAAYADQLHAAGVPTDDAVHLVLGDRTTSRHRLADLLPVYRDRRRRLERLLDAHVARGTAAHWGDARYRACGRCDVCAPEVERHRDLLLVAGMRSTQRARLHTAGVTTIDALATSTAAVDGIGTATLAGLRAQAALQVRQGEPHDEPLVFDLVDPGAVADLPAPDAGDIFFDFEGDPLWTDDSTPPDEPAQWGLEYLFGVVEADGTFRPFWAHDRAQEKQALVEFLAYVAERRREHPAMHVYHYAPYERSALLRLAARHGVGEEAVDQLLREGVLVDLYATVRRGLRVGSSSYSLKKLEPLYMGDEGRDGEVTTAGDSIVEYAEACAERERGDEQAWQERLDAIADYNRYDCVSTLRLRDWLVARGAERGVVPAARPVTERDEVDEHETDELVVRLTKSAEETEGPDGTALGLLAAALGYHRREDKPFWWAHFDRLQSDPADWLDPRSTLLADEPPTVVRDWYVPPRGRANRRELRFVGHLEPGSDLREGEKAYALYDPAPPFAKTSSGGHRGWTSNVTVLGTRTEPDPQSPSGTRDVVLVSEALATTDTPTPALPMALGPAEPPRTDGIAAAIRSVAQSVADGLPAFPTHPAVDILRRVPPRTRSGLPLPRPDTPGDTASTIGTIGTPEAITSAVLDLDRSYVAVQGPPGTGKTYTGGHVIAALAAQGWKVGVVAQSHAVVENMLRSVAGAGLDPARIAKKYTTHPPTDPVWQPLKNDRDFGAFYGRQAGGFVVGGTTWDFTNENRIPRGSLDLVVVDEAGQFALANTVAVSVAGRNLLLLGDPQQLPQVSKGSHPVPVDRSALGWLADGHDTLPDELGYFLDRTWRMHPALTEAVSRLSYEDRLTSVEHTARRSLEGVAPGVRTVLVDHEGHSVASPTEAAAVLGTVRDLVGRRWQDPRAGVDRPLAPRDVLVVAPYNAQVWTVRRALEKAGLGDVRVGTVDRFQGQEAPVVIVTTTASSADDVPRGMEFLLNRNRVNVAISRAQWCAVVIRSRALTDYLPTGPTQLAELGAFLGLTIH